MRRVAAHDQAAATSTCVMRAHRRTVNPGHARVAFGGHGAIPRRCSIEPTVADGRVALTTRVMGEEIFGPVAARHHLARSLDEALEIVRSISSSRWRATSSREEPAAFQHRVLILDAVRCGGATVNDVVIHAERATHMGFGGVRQLRHGRLPRQGGLRLRSRTTSPP